MGSRAPARKGTAATFASTMAGMLPILVPAPSAPPKPTRRQIDAARRAAAHAAAGHTERASLHLEAAKSASGEEREGLERMAKAHAEAAARFIGEESRHAMALRALGPVS